ncbi:MAG: hypothetical protein Q7U59_02480 [Lutibacter sp.]|nr:hypothetical protein [Lutibacter sp.]MDP3358464.1 hypothetical protein [Lutibacter sp.]
MQTFYLRKPNGEKETLILFSCYFKNEQKQFVYSKIHHQVINAVKIDAVQSVFGGM